MRRTVACVCLLGSLIVGGCAASPRRGAPAVAQESDAWFRAGQRRLAEERARRPIVGRAKNVILFVGDGLDVPTITAARILEGQLRGQSGEENFLSFERLPYRALLKTYNSNQQVADSAGAATALLAGVKTSAGVVGLDEAAVRGDCASARGHEVTSLFRLAQEAGLATGLVSTARLTHATPAAAYGHSPERNWEADSDMPADAIAQGCTDLAHQLVGGEVGSALRVALGGGWSYFLPYETEGPRGESGRRGDGRDLIAEWQRAHPGGRYVTTRDELLAIEPEGAEWVLGLFAPDHMAFAPDRAGTGEPSLPEMTSRALDILETEEDGYLLLVEAGRIDHAHHYDNAYRALVATIELAAAVQEVLDRTDPRETLVVVTSDHGHTLTISGYPTRGNPILGLVVENDPTGRSRGIPALGLDGKPYTTLGYRNGPSASRGVRPDVSRYDTAAPNFQQEASVPLGLETHGGADVPSFARGPMAHLLAGTVEQSYVFHVLREAAGLGG